MYVKYSYFSFANLNLFYLFFHLIWHILSYFTDICQRIVFCLKRLEERYLKNSFSYEKGHYISGGGGANSLTVRHSRSSCFLPWSHFMRGRARSHTPLVKHHKEGRIKLNVAPETIRTRAPPQRRSIRQSHKRILNRKINGTISSCFCLEWLSVV